MSVCQKVKLIQDLACSYETERVYNILLITRNGLHAQIFSMD